MDILQYIVDHSKKDSDLDNLKKALDQNMDKIKSNVQQIIVNALNHLTPEAHTLGLVYLLYEIYMIYVHHLFTHNRKFCNSQTHERNI